MKRTEHIELEEMDKQLLKLTLPPKPYEYDHHDAGFCGSPACYKWDEDVKKFKDAGILNYMLAKQRVLDAVYSSNGVTTEGASLEDAVANFLIAVPQEVQLHMGLNLDLIYEYEKEVRVIRERLKALKADLAGGIQSTTSSFKSMMDATNM